MLRFHDGPDGCNGPCGVFPTKRHQFLSELSLSSLSTSDHHELEAILTELLHYTEERRITISLPSLRVDNFSEAFLEKIKRIRKSGLTFAPEAGTQRLRDVINKNVTEEEMIEKIKMETRRYAKRQMTWFRKNKQTIWLDGQAEIQDNIKIILEGLN